MGEPVVTLGPVSAPVVRTGVQAGSGAFIVQGLILFELVTLTGAQQGWLTSALTVAIAWGQNWLERRRGRKLIGAPAT